MKVFETLSVAYVFALKFHDDVLWFGSVFIHVHGKNIGLPVCKLIPSVLGNILEFILSFLLLFPPL